MNELLNMDRVSDIEEGDAPADVIAQPDITISDTETQAKCLIPLLEIPGVTTADRLPLRVTSPGG